MVTRTMQMYMVLGCSVLYLNMGMAKPLPKPPTDLATAASDGKYNVKYFKRGDGKDFENGYSKSTEDKDNGGYDKFEEFHKKDGDKYDHEEHESYGKLKNGNYKNKKCFLSLCVCWQSLR